MPLYKSLCPTCRSHSFAKKELRERLETRDTGFARIRRNGHRVFICRTCDTVFATQHHPTANTNVSIGMRATGRESLVGLYEACRSRAEI